MKKIIFLLSLFLIVVLVSCGSYSAKGETSVVSSSLPSGDEIPSNDIVDSSLYLPFIFKNYPADPSIFGIQIGNPNEATLTSAQNAKVNWVREYAIRWIDVQPNSNDEWNWEALAPLEEMLISANEKDLEVILIIHTAPEWAQKYKGVICGPIGEDYLDDFANFMKEVVKKYSVPPYNVKYWELGNEPDVLRSKDNPSGPYGCWAETKDVDLYYGGGYYAEMLKNVYPVLKSVDPEAKVVLGGLLLNCDPTNIGRDGGCLLKEENVVPANFFEGILNSGGGDYFDVVSFHGYTQMPPDNTVNPIKLEKDYLYWKLKGGVVQGKINYINEMLAKYNVTNKSLILSESGFLCKNCEPDNEFLLKGKASYLTWSYVKNWSEGIHGVIWYTFDYPGWRNGSILGVEQSEDTLAYKALEFLTKELDRGEYRGKLSGLPENGIGFEFFVSDYQKMWILFSTDNDSYEFSLPSNYLYLKNHLGEDIISTDDGTVTVEPLVPIMIRMNR